MRLRRLTYVITSAALSMSSLFVLASPVAHAANIAWDGGAGDYKFNTAANWVGDVLPSNGDAITIDNSVVSNGSTIDNDMIGLSLSGISFTGSGTTDYSIVGNDISVGGTINYSAASPKLKLNIVLNADTTISGTSAAVIGNEQTGSENTFDLGGHNLDIQGNIYTESNIIGVGNISVTSNGKLWLNGDNTFTGAINVGSANAPELYLLNPQGFGNSNNTVSATGLGSRLYFCSLNGATISNPISPNGSIWASNSCKTASSDTQPFDATASVTLSGQLTLTSELYINTVGEVKLTGPILGAYNIKISSGDVGKVTIESSNNQSNTANGTLTAEPMVVDMSMVAPGTDIGAGPNKIILVGSSVTAGNITIVGGALKGTGTVGTINMSSGSLAPGMSPGVLNSGNFTATGGNYDVEIGGKDAGQYDQLNVAGTVDLGSATTLNVSQWNGYTPSLNDSFIIINNDGSDAVTGTFVGLADGATLTVGGITYMINYSAGDGNDVALTVTGLSAEAAAAAAASAPNTGFELLNNHPVVSVFVTLASVLGIAYIARKQIITKK